MINAHNPSVFIIIKVVHPSSEYPAGNRYESTITGYQRQHQVSRGGNTNSVFLVKLLGEVDLDSQL